MPTRPPDPGIPVATTVAPEYPTEAPGGEPTTQPEEVTDPPTPCNSCKLSSLRLITASWGYAYSDAEETVVNGCKQALLTCNPGTGYTCAELVIMRYYTEQGGIGDIGDTDGQIATNLLECKEDGSWYSDDKKFEAYYCYQNNCLPGGR